MEQGVNPVELCGEVKLAVERLDPKHHTRTIITLYRSLLLQLSKMQSNYMVSLLSYVHVKLADVFNFYTANKDLAIESYSKCIQLGKSSVSNCGEDPSVMENALYSLWQTHHIYAQMNNPGQAKRALSDNLSLAKLHPRWFYRVVFQLLRLNTASGNVDNAVQICIMGENYAEKLKTQYMFLLMRLTRLSLYLKSSNVDEAQALLRELEGSVNTFFSTTQNEFHGHHIKVHYLILYNFFYLMRGKIKTGRGCLKQLQEAMKVFTQASFEGIKSKNPAEQFSWLSTEHVCILAYLITLNHHCSGGQLEKAKKYSEKALAQVDILRSGFSSTDDVTSEANQLLIKMHMMILQSSVQCDLVIGQKQHAIKKVSQIMKIGREIPCFYEKYGPQVHMLLGLYSMTMNYMDKAEAQFQSVLSNSTNKDLVIFAALNLSAIFFRTGNRQSETTTILAKVDPEKFPSPSESLRAAAYFLRSLQAFYNGKFQEAKKFIRETLRIANEEDISRLTTCSLVLLGHIFLVNQSLKECSETVVPALKLAEKVPDAHAKLWAAALLQDVVKLGNSSGSSAFLPAGLPPPEQTHASVKQQLLADFLESNKLPEHELIQWIDGPLPEKFSNLQ